MCGLSQGGGHKAEGEPVYRQAAAHHPPRHLHRDPGQQLFAQEGGGRRRRPHTGGLQRRQAGRGQARHEEEVSGFCFVCQIVNYRWLCLSLKSEPCKESFLGCKM